MAGLLLLDTTVGRRAGAGSTTSRQGAGYATQLFMGVFAPASFSNASALQATLEQAVVELHALLRVQREQILNLVGRALLDRRRQCRISGRGAVHCEKGIVPRDFLQVSLNRGSSVGHPRIARIMITSPVARVHLDSQFAFEVHISHTHFQRRTTSDACESVASTAPLLLPKLVELKPASQYWACVKLHRASISATLEL